MATGEEILAVAQNHHPSWVCGGDWLDLSPPVTVIVPGKDDYQGVHLLDPVAGMAVLNGSDDVVAIGDFKVGQIQGKPVGGIHCHGEVADELEVFLNVVADERMLDPNGSGNKVQTPAAVEARRLINIFYITRRKGLSLKSRSGS